MQCVQCGNSLKETAKICIRCGTPVAKGGAEAPATQPLPSQHVEAAAKEVDTPAPVEVVAEPVAPEVVAAPVVHEAPISPPAPVVEPSALDAVASVVVSPPKVEVAPEFAEVRNVSNVATKAEPSPKNNMRLIAGGAGLVVVLAAVYALSKPSGSEKPELAVKAPAVAEAPPIPKPSDLASSPTTAVVTAASGTMSKEVLNQILSASGKGEWNQVDTLLAQSQPMQFTTVNRNKARQLNQKGLDALKQSLFDEAVAQFKNGMVEDPNDAEIKNNLAFTYIKMKQFDLARSAIVDSLLVSPSRGPAWLNASEIFAELNNPQIASQALQAALHFANNKQKAIETLSDDSKVPSEKMRAVIKATLPEAGQIPTYKRN